MTTFIEHLRDALAPAYELGPELQGAGMSRVFVANDVALGRKVVVKVLPPDLAAGVNRDRFRREIQLAAQLQHPHIVPLLSAGEHGELLYYTMPFIEGESLRSRLERKARLSVREVMRMLHDVVDALDYAHARGVVHRDIKPGNILTQGQHALVTDFGVAKALSAALPVSGMTSSGMAIGTPAYMAPEQLAADPAADQRVDIYAVGLLAYELLSGESPFVGPSPTATMAAQLTRDPAPIDTIRGDVPPALSAVIMRCLAKAPELRPQTASDLLAELELIPMPSGPSTPTQTMPMQAVRRRVSPTLMTAGAGLLLLGAAALFASRGRTAPPAADSASTTAAAVPAAPAAPEPAPAGTTSQAARAVLTRDDSLAIAQAVRAQLAAPAARGTTRSPTAAEKQAAVADRRVIDSIVRASLAEWSRPGAVGPALRDLPRYMERVGRMRLDTLQLPGVASRSGPRRVVITEPQASPAHPELSAIGASVVGSLRSALSHRKEYQLVDQNTVRGVLSQTREASQVAARLGADVIASVDLIPVPGDSVVLLVKIRDLSAQPQYSYRVAGGRTMAASELPAGAGPMVDAALGYIDEMTGAPRRSTRIVVVPEPPATPDR
ncbi:MAG: serine/threonine-protein kinase [Bacillota bacterium]|jgi:serine/threonine-protein kinase